MVFFSVEAACCLPSYSIFPSPECFLASGSCKTLFSNMQHSELTAVAEQGQHPSSCCTAANCWQYRWQRGKNQTSTWTSVPFSNLRNSVERGIGHKYFSLPFRLGASWSWALQLMLFCDQRELSFKVSTQSLCCCMLSFTDGESAPCVSQLICRAQHSVPHITAN